MHLCLLSAVFDLSYFVSWWNLHSLIIEWKPQGLVYIIVGKVLGCSLGGQCFKVQESHVFLLDNLTELGYLCQWGTWQSAYRITEGGGGLVTIGSNSGRLDRSTFTVHYWNNFNGQYEIWFSKHEKLLFLFSFIFVLLALI